MFNIFKIIYFFKYPFYWYLNLQLLEQELELQHKEFGKLNGSAQNLVTHLEQDNQAIDDIRSRLDEFSQRWDSIVQQMEAHSKAVSMKVVGGQGRGGDSDLVKHLEQDNQAIGDIRSRLDEFSQRWDSIVQQMEAHSKAVSIKVVGGGVGLCIQDFVLHVEQKNQAVDDIRSRLDEFSQRWDNIAQQMKAHKNKGYQSRRG